MEEFPKFRYHPDSLAHGLFEESSIPCSCCGRSRGYVYTSSVYREGDEELSLCPWCIADGSAAEKFDAEFTDSNSLYDAGLPQEIIDEVVKRTPGFVSWQSERWLSCCNDACAFLGDATVKDLEATDVSQRRTIMEDFGDDEERFEELLDRFSSSGGGIAFYKFKCLHCGKLHYYCDFD